MDIKVPELDTLQWLNLTYKAEALRSKAEAMSAQAQVTEQNATNRLTQIKITLDPDDTHDFSLSPDGILTLTQRQDNGSKTGTEDPV